MSNNIIKSPLRYPGGKSKAINQIVEYLPDSFAANLPERTCREDFLSGKVRGQNLMSGKFAEFREPFVGGGSVFIYLKQKFPHLKIWINDLNRELFLFWKYSQTHLSKLVEEIWWVKKHYQNGRLLFEELTNVDINQLADLDRAVRFFVLNRITFSGTVESGGFSEQAFQKRFTDSSIQRLEKLATILTADIKITNLDYSELLQPNNNNLLIQTVKTDIKTNQTEQKQDINSNLSNQISNHISNHIFIYLDPPYFAATKSKLYGKDGNLHTSFDHHRFAHTVLNCPYNWLITYDDSAYIRENFQSAYIHEWELQYGMNNYKQDSAAKGKELFITNYLINSQSNIDTNC